MFVDIIRGVLGEVGLNYELIFVNDGSEDRTFDRAVELAQADPRLRVLNLSRNFGKEIAITAGIDQAAGDVVVPMDVDLQDPPELIPRFIERWREGYDVVYGVRTCRKHDTLAKRASAR